MDDKTKHACNVDTFTLEISPHARLVVLHASNVIVFTSYILTLFVC